jgi:hypothetical protein
MFGPLESRHTLWILLSWNGVCVENPMVVYIQLLVVDAQPVALAATDNKPAEMVPVDY